MGFYQSINYIDNNILSVEPITWGDFKILGLQENYPKDYPLFYNFYKYQNENWCKLIRGILTNNINLVRDNVDKVNILNAIPVITNDPYNMIKFFDVKEAKKYSNNEIVNYLRGKYNEKSLNAPWSAQQTSTTLRGSFFSTVPSFDGVQPVKVMGSKVKPFRTPIVFNEVRIIGIPIKKSISLNDSEDIMNLNLLLAVLSGNLESVKNIIQSYFNISTIQTVITENLNELHLDLVYEAKRLGFNEIARYLEAVEKAQGKSFGNSFSEWLKFQKQDSELKLKEFLKPDIPMEED